MIRTRSRATRVRYVVMAFLCALAFLSYLDRVCISRAQGDIQRDLHLTDTQIGLVMSIFWLGYAVFEIPGGWLGDRFGSRSTLSRIVVAWSLFTALSGAATGFVSLLVYRLLFGAGEAGAFPNMARVQSRWLPARSRARAGGFIWLFARWGGAFSFPLFGYLLSGFQSHAFRRALAHLPILYRLPDVPAWRLGFWAMAGLGVIWVVLFYPWFRDDPAEMPDVNEAELHTIRDGSGSETTVHTSHGDRSVFAALFTDANLWTLALAYLCVSFGWSFFVSWMPRYLFDVHHLSFEGSQRMDVLPLFLGGIACLLGGIVSDWVVRATEWKRFGRAMFPIMGYAIAGMAMLAIRVTHTPRQAIALMCVASAASDFGQGACWATIVGIGGLYAGSAFGFMNMIGNIGNLQPYVGAVIFNHFGWNALLMVYSGAYLAAACLWLFIDPRKRFYERAASS